jgi:hypothetical protein
MGRIMDNISKIMEKLLIVPAAIIGVALVPLAFVLILPDFIYSMKDGLLNTSRE